jgi:hypothetical protein
MEALAAVAGGAGLEPDDEAEGEGGDSVGALSGRVGV